MTRRHMVYTPWQRLIVAGLAVIRRPNRLWCACRQWGHRALQRLEVAVTPLSERPLLCLCSGVLAGSGLGMIVPLTPLLIGLLLGAATILVLPWPFPQTQRCCRIASLGLLLTHGHALWQMRAVPLDHIAYLLTTQPAPPLTVDGILERPIEPLGDRQRLHLRVQRVERPQGWQTASGLVRLSVHTDHLPFLPGDLLRVTRLRLHEVRGFQNPGAFNFQRFMQRQGITVVGGVSDAARLSLQHRPQGFSLARLIEQWRQHLQARTRAALSAPYDAIFLAMVLGHRGQLSTMVEEAFRKTGTAHLLVVSGLNVGFIAAAFMLMWRPLLREVRSRLPRSWLPGWRPTPLALLLLLPPVAPLLDAGRMASTHSARRLDARLLYAGVSPGPQAGNFVRAAPRRHLDSAA